MANYRYYLKDVARPNEDLVVLELADINGKPVFSYKPGQYVMISYLDETGNLKQRHAFSIASSPSQNNHLILGIRVGGSFTRGLLNLKVGSPISVAGPYGNFIFNPRKHKDLVLLAGGIGITPFFSAMAYATDNNLPNKLSLLYSARTLKGVTFLEEIKQLESRNSNLKTLLSITDEKIPQGTPGIVNEKINSQIIQNFVGDVKNKTFFICGPAPFMEAVKNNLLGLGVYKSQIEMETFSMLDENSLWPQLKNLSYATVLSAAAVAIIFYSISNSDALAKSLKSAGNSINSASDNLFNSPTLINNSQSAPSPVTSVSGVPTTTPSSSGSQKTSSPTTTLNSSNATKQIATPTPVTASSAPTNNNRQQNYTEEDD